MYELELFSIIRQMGQEKVYIGLSFDWLIDVIGEIEPFSIFSKNMCRGIWGSLSAYLALGLPLFHVHKTVT